MRQATAQTNGIQLLTFDAVGTLIRPHPGVGAVYSAVMTQHGYPATAKAVERQFRQCIKNYTVYRKAHPVTPADRAYWRAIVSDSIAPWVADAAARERIFEQLYQEFAAPEQWRILPAVPETLAKLRDRGHRLAVLSNADQRFHHVLAALELTPYFEAIFLSGEIGHEKPDRRIFRHVERHYALPPEAICHIGDSPIHDIAGARDAGWQALQVGDGGSLRFADLPQQLPPPHRPRLDGDPLHA